MSKGGKIGGERQGDEQQHDRTRWYRDSTSQSQGCLAEWELSEVYSVLCPLTTVLKTSIHSCEYNRKTSAPCIQGGTMHGRAHRSRACLRGVSSLTWETTNGSEKKQNGKIATTTKFSNFPPSITNSNTRLGSIITFPLLPLWSGSHLLASPTWRRQRTPAISRPGAGSTGAALTDVSGIYHGC